MSHSKGSKAKVIASLVEGKTVPTSAQLAGVTPRTVYRWLDEPAFQDELRRQEKQVLDACSLRLAGMTKKALDALEDVLECPALKGAGVQRLAAVSILELVLKWRDLVDFEERLTNLERQVNSEQGK